MKTSKKLLSLLLVLTLLLSVSVPAFAAGGSTKVTTKPAKTEPYKVAYLGDSMSIGYLLKGYLDDYSHCGIGARQTGTHNYPTQFTDYLKNKLGRDVDPSYLGATGMRPNELCVLLAKDSFPEATRDGFTVKHLELYEDTYSVEVGKDLYATYQNAVKDADLIVYDLGINNFGTYMMNRILSILNNGEKVDDIDFNSDSLAMILGQLSPELGKSVDDIRAFNRQMLEPLGAQIADPLIDTLVYSYASFLYYFDRSMDLIYKENKDVDVIVVGMFNPIGNAKISIGGLPIVDLGEIMQNTFSSMNFYITGQNEHRFQYKYADISGGISRFLDEIARGVNASRNPMTDYTRDFLIDDFYGTLGDSKAAGVIGQNYDQLKKDEIAFNSEEPVAISLTPAEEIVEEAAPVEEIVEEAAPVEEIVEEAAPAEEIVEEAAPVEEIVEEAAPAEEIVEEAAPVEEIVEEAAPVEEIVEEMIVTVEEQTNDLEAAPTLVNRDAAKAAFYEGDYSAFAPLDKDTVRAAVTMILENYRKAASNTTIDFNSISAFAAGEETYAPLVAQAMMDFDGAERAGQDLFFIKLAFLAVRGFGMHPDQLGTNQKLAAIQCAYCNPISAAGNVPAKLIEAPVKAVNEVVKSVLVPPTKLVPSVVKGVINATKSIFAIRW